MFIGSFERRVKLEYGPVCVFAVLLAWLRECRERLRVEAHSAGRRKDAHSEGVPRDVPARFLLRGEGVSRVAAGSWRTLLRRSGDEERGCRVERVSLPFETVLFLLFGARAEEYAGVAVSAFIVFCLAFPF